MFISIPFAFYDFGVEAVIIAAVLLCVFLYVFDFQQAPERTKGV
jgi:hypothetical protein